MALLTLVEAKQQLNELSDEDDLYIESLIPAAMGLVEASIGRDILEKQSDITDASVDPVIFELLTPSKQASLKVAIKLQLSSLYINREADIDSGSVNNPAYELAIASFKRVRIG